MLVKMRWINKGTTTLVHKECLLLRNIYHQTLFSQNQNTSYSKKHLEENIKYIYLNKLLHEVISAKQKTYIGYLEWGTIMSF